MKHKMPPRYKQKQREAKREQDIKFARMFRFHSRHDDDPEGSQRWVETGKWTALGEENPDEWHH